MAECGDCPTPQACERRGCWKLADDAGWTDCRDDPKWSCGTCGKVVEREWRVFGSCYRCAARRSIKKRNDEIASLKIALEGERLISADLRARLAELEQEVASLKREVEYQEESFDRTARRLRDLWSV